VLHVAPIHRYRERTFLLPQISRNYLRVSLANRFPRETSSSRSNGPDDRAARSSRHRASASGRQPRRLTLSISPADAGASLSHRLSRERIIAHRHARASVSSPPRGKAALANPRADTHLEESMNPITILHATTRRSLTWILFIGSRTPASVSVSGIATLVPQASLIRCRKIFSFFQAIECF